MVSEEKAVNNMKRVVGVIGKSHMNSVVYALISDQGVLSFRAVAGKSPPSNRNANGWFDSFVKSLAWDTIMGLVAWALFQLLKTALPWSNNVT